MDDLFSFAKMLFLFREDNDFLLIIYSRGK